MKQKAKKTIRASHRKAHLAALSNPGARQALETLREDWAKLNDVQRGDRLIQMLSTGCTERGMADDLEVDDGTIRRAIEIARLPEPQRKDIEGGASPKLYLTESHYLNLFNDMQERIKCEANGGRPSDELRDKLAWFLMKEQPWICRSVGYVERLIGEVQDDLREMGRHGQVKHAVKVMRPLDPAYPLGRAIKIAQPEPEPEDDQEPMATAILWLMKLILLLEPAKIVRDPAVDKLKATLLRLQFRTRRDIQKLAAAHTPATLAAVMREWQPEKPLYH